MTTESSDFARLPRTPYITQKLNENRPAKAAIARVIANKYVQDRDSVLLDAGSTAEIIAAELFRSRRYLAVLTNNLGAYASYARAQLSKGTLSVGSSGNELLLTGGRYDDMYEALLGKVTESSIRSFVPNVTIIGVSGVKCEEGVFCHGADESSVKALLWTKKTDRRIIATDWTKLGRLDAHEFGRVEQMHFDADQAILVTSRPPSDTPSDEVQRFDFEVKALQQRSIHVVCVDVLESREGDQP